MKHILENIKSRSTSDVCKLDFRMCEVRDVLLGEGEVFSPQKEEAR